MKYISLTLNIILLAAVGYLFYKQTSDAKNTDKTEINEQAPAVTLVKDTSTIIPGMVFVNIDSLNAGYDLLKDFTKVIDSKRSKIESQYQAKALAFENEYKDYQQMMQAGIAPPASVREKENKLKALEQEVTGLEQKMRELAEEVQKKNIEMDKNLKEFLNEYNADGRYTFVMAYTNSSTGEMLYARPDKEITKEVIAGMNNKYKAKSKK